MRLRPYGSGPDFEAIRRWISDERTHAMWCANRMPYPLERESFEATLADLGDRFGDAPFVAVVDGGEPVGFFCYSTDFMTSEGTLKFIVIAPGFRGRGLGGRMLEQAVKHAFEIAGADAVRLSVFSENERAKKCYLKAGFVESARTERAFRFHDEWWDRYTMVRKRDVSG